MRESTLGSTASPSFKCVPASLTVFCRSPSLPSAHLPPILPSSRVERTRLQMLNGFVKMVTQGDGLEENGIASTFLSPIEARFEVCIAVSVLKFTDLDVECARGFEFEAYLHLWGSEWFLRTEAHMNFLGGKMGFGAAKVKMRIRHPMQMILGFIQSIIDVWTDGKGVTTPQQL